MIDLRPYPTEALESYLKYQRERPATFFNPCAQGCGQTARGGGVCTACLTLEIEKRKAEAAKAKAEREGEVK